MKLCSLFTSMVASSPIMPLLLMEKAKEESTKMMLMMNAMNMYPNDPLTQIMPLLMLSEDEDTTSTTGTSTGTSTGTGTSTSTSTTEDNENAKLLMMMTMMNPASAGDVNNIMPLLFMNDDTVDMKSMLVYSAILNQDCTHSTNHQINQLLPLMLAKEKETDEKLKTMIMFQMMAGAGKHLDMNELLMHIMLEDKIEDNPLMLILLQAMTGDVNTPSGYDNSFNLMLPMVLADDCTEATVTDKDACKKKQKDLMIMMMMMGAQTPNSGTSINSILPMMLMDDKDDNSMLIMFMMMQQQPCLPIQEKPEAKIPAKVRFYLYG